MIVPAGEPPSPRLPAALSVFFTQCKGQKGASRGQIRAGLLLEPCSAGQPCSGEAIRRVLDGQGRLESLARQVLNKVRLLLFPFESTIEARVEIMANFLDNLLKKVRTRLSRRSVEDAQRVSRVFRFKYGCFKDLLASNSELLNIVTDFEEKLRGQEIFGMSYVRSQATRAIFHTLRMVKALDDLAAHRYQKLFEVLENINVKIKDELGKRKELPLTELVLPYSRINKEMVDWVGGKNSNLGELMNRVRVPVPEGFAITTRAYELFLESNDLVDEINRIRLALDPNDPAAVNQVSEDIQRLIIMARVPPELVDEMQAAYCEISETIRHRTDGAVTSPQVALRSSAIGEDSELSYAGQYLSILNVPQDKIVETYKYIIASLYTPRAVSYRLNKGMRDEDIAMSVACIEMVDSVASGVVYSRHPFSLLEDAVLVTAVWGLGPYAVDGVVTPDSWVVSKDDQARILERKISTKPVQLKTEPGGGLSERQVDQDKQNSPCLTDEQIRQLAAYAVILEEHYKYPQDIEWALDPHGRILILQARPLHIEEMEARGFQAFAPVDGFPVLAEGGAIAFPGVGYGPAHFVTNNDDLIDFPDGAVLIAKHSTPEFVMVMQRAQGIVTDAGSVTGHMASLAREFGVPTILDTKTATRSIKAGTYVTVDAYSGRVYEGRVEELIALARTKESAMKDTPVYQTLRRVADWIVPLNLVNPRSPNFTPEHCETLHDVMRYVHEYSYREMFQISDLVSATGGGGSLKLVAPIPLDLHIIDLGGGITDGSLFLKRATVDQISSFPFKALLKGMLHEDLRFQGPRPVDLSGFFAVVREQMFAPNGMGERFGDRSYAIISDHYLNFSSRIGYHYSVLDSFCSESVNKNYITFSFKGGAADEIRRNRRVRAIASIFEELGFQVEAREDRVDARYYKYEQALIEEKLDALGRLLQYTRQMDMLMHSEATVELLAKNFLAGNYTYDVEAIRKLDAEKNGSTEP